MPRDRVTCPSCKREVPNRAHVRQGVAVGGALDGLARVSVGFRYPECDHVWGHEIALPVEDQRDER